MNALAALRNALVSGAGATNIAVALALIAAVIAIVAAVVSALSSSSPRARARALLADRAASSGGSSRWVIRIGLPLLAIIALATADLYMSSTGTCMTCHRDSPEAEAMAKTTHAGIACARCHLPGGVTNVGRRMTTYARWVAVYGVTKQPPVPVPGSVGNGPCLACHDVGGGDVVTTRAIRVRHSDMLEQGAQCRECHNSVAHPGAVLEPSEPTMDPCTLCHDGDRAPSACGTCHVRDVALDSAAPRGYSRLKTAGAWNVCYRCHDPAPCTRCHGVLMPHPPGWSPNDPVTPGYGHARDGFARRELCWRCHHSPGKPFEPAEESCSCHGVLGTQHGGAAWVEEHGPEATGRYSGTNNTCFDCHSAGLCDYCHDGYAARYAPRDDVPLNPAYAQPAGGPAQDF
ncbi:MAG: hypothetical protein C0418_02370 [Coriobacteriaceae bacterium]|nr:hypothetical protein [Coriobacteriaceae bacterium]